MNALGHGIITAHQRFCTPFLVKLAWFFLVALCLVQVGLAALAVR